MSEIKNKVCIGSVRIFELALQCNIHFNVKNIAFELILLIIIILQLILIECNKYKKSNTNNIILRKLPTERNRNESIKAIKEMGIYK